MKVVILAAGYATRLYPLTLNTPKPLLLVAGRPLIERVLESLQPLPNVEVVYVVTNAKFAGHFESWAESYQSKVKFKLQVVNDKSLDNDSRLGAIGDLHLVLEGQKIDDDLVVVAGDNLFSEKLSGFADLISRGVRSPIVGVYDVKTVEEARKFGVVALDPNSRIVTFEEKPANPPSTLISTALYFYPKESLAFIRQYIAEKNNPDQSGLLVKWLCTRVPVLAWQVIGKWLDIGSKETLAAADTLFSNRQ